ncbi:dTMP kinase [Sphingomonas sp. C3-2]|uniref:dTMP kinase n=1 Tax=Sphingomonas sp. C3-2 TaxID=3062169 RepID=UPI00294B3DEC|nr:dTMP kinase [Sphingomonas sp. C3-2]WOK36737.1 dTMP kinase [Sphingomonas sp. C3-2]
MIDRRIMQSYRGVFIVVEGCDGSGKGSAVAALGAHLMALGHDVLLTREPGGTDEGLELRRLLLSAEGAIWDEGAELLLMIAARIQHVKRVIQPALAAGRVVLCDRYVGSTLAYQGAGRGLSQEMILMLHRQFVDDFWPDLTVLLDVDARLGLTRSRARLVEQGLDEGRFEDLDLAFHQRVGDDFRAQAGRCQDRTLVIDANPTMDIVREAVLNGVDAWLAERVVA